MKWKSLFLPLCAATLLGCSGDSVSPPPDDTGGNGLTVAVRNNLFAPASLQVPLNSTVTWQWNSGGVEHNVTFDTEPNSGNRSSGSFSRIFPTAGAYAYVCTIHGAQAMSGVVTVTAGTGGGGGGGGGDGGDGGGYGP
jgi:plastocyanin